MSESYLAVVPQNLANPTLPHHLPSIQLRVIYGITRDNRVCSSYICNLSFLVTAARGLVEAVATWAAVAGAAEPVFDAVFAHFEFLCFLAVWFGSGGFC